MVHGGSESAAPLKPSVTPLVVLHFALGKVETSAQDPPATTYPQLPDFMKNKLLAVLLLLPMGLVACAPPVKPPAPPLPPTDDASITPIGTAQTYVGSVGVHSAVFVLTWQPDGNVVGHYYHPDNSGVIFKLKGKNTGHGELVLTEYAADVQSAIITLKKTTSRGLIVWSGKMHDTDKHDSHVLDVSFTRKADA